MDEFKGYDNNEVNNNVNSNDEFDNVQDVVIKEEIIYEKKLPINEYNNSYSNQCFKEKVKNEKKKPHYFRKIVAFALVAVLLGSAFQLGMGFTKPFIAKYINPQIANNTNQTTKFAFDEGIDVKDTVMNGTINNSIEQVASNYTSIINGNYVSPVVAIAENMKPSIVTITSVVTSRDWFNNQYDEEGTGSGIIFGEDEESILIVTNQHVINGAKNVIITFYNSENVNAQIVGYEREYDLAVLSVQKKKMNKELLNSIKIAKLGDSDKIKVGGLAVAIGNPLGKRYSNTVTVGYISAINRTLQSTDKSIPLIQTDAAINPGNSGGALVNARSEVIGINSYKLASTNIEGMAFAIPINEAKPIIEDIVNQIDRPVLGIRGKDITNELAEIYDLPLGIYVKQIIKGSGADKAGLRPQDIIFEFGGTKVFNFERLTQELENYKVGDIVSVKVARMVGDRLKKVELNVKLSDRRSLEQ
jgi:serine protease Do